MQIAILGPGCSRCRQTAEVVRRAVEQAGIEATIRKVEDLREIMRIHVMKTPAVVVDGQVKISGEVPTVGEVLALLPRGGAGWAGPAVMITDTANFRNPHYHRSTDTIDTLNFDFLSSVADAVTAAVRSLAANQLEE